MFEKLNKKSAIAIAIIVILGIFAIAGTVIFLKDKGSTDAAEIASENSSDSETVKEEENKDNNTTSENNEKQENSNNTQGNNTKNNSQKSENKNNNNSKTTENSENVENNQTIQDTDNGVDSITESTITRVTEGDLVKVEDNRIVAWSQMDFNIKPVVSKIDSEKTEITVEKKATTKMGTNLTSKGEKIEYTLKVENNSDKDVKGVEVSDTIPEKTTYVEESASNDANVIKDGDKVVGLKWYVDISAQSSVEVKFTVKVNEDAEGTITNTALTNGNSTSEEVKTAIVTMEKSSKVYREIDKETTEVTGPVKENDKITYTILLKNTGDVSGLTSVKDADLKDILSDNKAEMIDGVSIYKNQELVNKHKTEQDLIDGINDIEVPAQGEARVEFSIKVNKISKAIKNTALIGNDEKETNSDVKETYGYNVKKELTSIERKGQKLDKNAPVQEGDILGYTITIENNGSTDIEDLYIKDIMPDSLEAQSDIEFKNVIVPAGETIKKEVKAKVKNVSGKIVNTVIAEDKNDTQEPDKESQEETQTIGFTINKEAKVIKADKNKDHAGYEEIAEEGDIILYTITVTNTGSTKLNSVRVEDRKSRVKIDEKIDLEPNGIDGYKKTITRNYQVVATDFELDELGKMKQINNVATATYEDSNGRIEKEDSANVTVRDSYDYTVEYYYDGVKDESATETYYGQYSEEITNYEEKLKDGYKLQRTENLPLTITGDSNTNVIKVYYTGIPNIVVNKAQSGSQDEKVEYGDTIIYTITAENKGTATGSVTIEDKIPNNSELSGDINLIKNGTTSKIEKSDLEAGNLLLTLASKEKATITFTVTVNGYAGKEVTNTAKYQKENETKKEETEPVNKKIEDMVNVISTTTTTTSVTTPQKAILVLDVSGSMNESITHLSWTSKLSAMKTAVGNFLTKFLPEGTENAVMIIPYSDYAVKEDICGFTSNYSTAVNFVNGLSASGGTNIDDGLTKAYENITDAKNTSVILMTDGLPCYYMEPNEKGELTRYSQGNGSSYAAKPAKHAKEAAQLIKNKGSKVYSIGFGLNRISKEGLILDEYDGVQWGYPRQEAKNLMKDIATSEKEYFDSYDENELNKAFENIAESITKTDESAPISYETQIGKITIPNENEKIFKPGQNVEIYKGEYQKGISQPYHTYSWNDFINLKKNIAGSEVQLVEYNAASGELKFDLGKYMESEGMSANENVTIRFIDQTANSQANTLSFTNSDIVVQGAVIEINEDDEENETQNLTETTKIEVVQNPTQTTDLPEEVEEKVEEKIETEEDSNKINEIEKQEDVKQDEKIDSKNSEDATSNEENTVNEEVNETDSEVKEETINEGIQIEQEQNLIEEEQNMLDENSTISE